MEIFVGMMSLVRTNVGDTRSARSCVSNELEQLYVGSLLWLQTHPRTCEYV